ncbi:MAG: dTDP-glucose 4,6-dehydratase, partial [Flavobacterium psychrophilum]
HAKGINLVLNNGVSGETYNIGGRNERTNNEIVKTICGILDNKRPRSDSKPYGDLITFVKDRAGHDRRYAIDASKLENELGWRADENFETGIKKTIDWYLNKY